MRSRWSGSSSIMSSFSIATDLAPGRSGYAGRVRHSRTYSSPATFIPGPMMIRILMDLHPIVGAIQNRAQKLLGVGRLERVAVGAVLRGLLHLVFVAHAGHHHHRNIAQLRRALDDRQHFLAVHSGHLDV